MQQLQQIRENVRVKNTIILKYGAQGLQHFAENAAENATYLLKFDAVEFVQTLATWLDESLMDHIRQSKFCSIVANACIDVVELEEFSIYCQWVENGLPVEHFIDILPLKKADAETISCLFEK